MKDPLNPLPLYLFFEFAALLVVVSHQKMVHVISADKETEFAPVRECDSFNHRKNFSGQGKPGYTEKEEDDTLYHPLVI